MRMATSSRVGAYLDRNPASKTVYGKISRHVSALRSSTYEITDQCNLKCEGCFFFDGESSRVARAASFEEFRGLFRAEVERGINYPYLSGGEPSMAPDILAEAARFWDRGLVYTNGSHPIDPDLPFMLQISTWGLAEDDVRRRADDFFSLIVRNYRRDPRAVLVYTVHALNIGSVMPTVQRVSDEGMRITFNHFSPTRDYAGRTPSSSHDSLELHADDLRRSHDVLLGALERYPQAVVYSRYYNDWVSRPGPLYDIDPESGMARDCKIYARMPHYRLHHLDLNWNNQECCTPNTACPTCRQFTAVFSQILGDLRRHLASEADFLGWLDVYDTWCRLHITGWDELA